MSLGSAARPSRSINPGPRSGVVTAAAPVKPPGFDKIAAGQDMPKEYSSYMPDWDKKRRAGVILHPTSLPGPYGIGELGQEAKNFVDWLDSAGMQCWQMLPLVPPDPMFYSPYSGTDANSGNPLIISIDELIKDGLLDFSDAPKKVPVGNVDFPAVAASKTPVLSKAAQNLLKVDRFSKLREEMQAFRKANKWVEESAVFDVARNLPDLADKAWWDWPEPLRFRKSDALKKFKEEHKSAIEEYIALQFLFDRQWKAVRAYANSKGIKIIGDMPIYVGGHSADVWSNQKLFELGPTGAPANVSGVPPDAFSATGQLWGSPLYKWSEHRAQRFDWWVQRMGRALQLYDETRIDHFRGFAGYWAVDGKAETAMNGSWKKGPGIDLFNALKKALGGVPILAEDLGVITADVVALREAIGAPGMVVLQFAWGGGPTNVHLPHNHYENCFVYPGTHDNETTVGWFHGSSSEEDKRYIRQYLRTDGKDIAWDFIGAAMQSVARTSIFMMQDVMRLDNKARMNVPGVAANNWLWRMGDGEVWGRLKKEAEDLRRLAGFSNRLPP
eukprot:CAMPEP_0202902880 /NCGR_PEP_ID=MMETSP1392-20130828/18588_1 /ASSEMBLY_ACC=CAM_ASM_000868 /TAXON_ID=225041 /ORGANISM="Chlamydomonas chlamydogama, Strain SAG 11-48b" /LENGTH=555 /DNA_ID=CAMNT_0049589739 /DNA_START=130 /DNA_END=1794 /DNA_ORIENTATION=-